ncbi:MAG: Ig domain-containing protein, partial [Terriglobales bacterium]
MKLSASRCVLTLALVISSLVLTASMSAQTLTLSCASGVGELGVVYDSALVVNGGVAPYTFSILSGSLPSGLTLDASSGAITGTPADKGTFNYVAQVADASGSLAKVKCQIKVWPHVSIDCPPKAKNIGAIGEPF